MRITNNMLINNMIGYMGTNLGRMEKYQNQLATGKKIKVPSDDPVIAARALKLRTDVSEVEQFKRNVKDATSWMETTETALTNVGDILQRARELAVQGSNGTNTPENTQKIAEEAKQLRDQLVHIANSTYSGRYIFSGYKTDKAVIDEVTGNYNFDVTLQENINFQIGIGDDINVNVPVGDLFQYNSDAAGGTKSALIDTFDQFITRLNAGPDNVKNSIGDIDVAMSNLLRVRASAGARMNRLELSGNRLEDDNLNFTKLMSDNEDVDTAETIMNLKNEENVYRASLSGGARIIMPTLVDFLR